DRMDYTIIGAEANLAARLQSVAEAGRVVISYETYALVRTMIEAHPLSPITMKGISREVVPYVVEGLLDSAGRRSTIINEHTAGLDIYIDPTMVDERSAERAQHLLLHALDTLRKRTGKS
ncbi:MAG: adenylate/guanylate cyclase domain-containing protein, partial [Vicinamibacteria bacterium]